MTEVEFKRVKLWRIYEKVVRMFGLFPYGISANKDVWYNARSAKNLIQLCADLGIIPNTIVDVGANNSQWVKWLVDKWPSVKVLSFEPNPNFLPVGKVHRLALGDREELVFMDNNFGSSHITEKGSLAVKVVRFDQLDVGLLSKPILLKVDCENYTSKAIAGFGERLREFDVVVCEMWNYRAGNLAFSNQQAEIWRSMLDCGKRGCRIIDSEWSYKEGIAYYDAAFY